MASTLAEQLRGQPDQALAALLRARPDLLVPVPADLAALAARAQARGSVARVLDRLDRFQLEILDALRLTRDPDGVTSLDQVLALVAASGWSEAEPAVKRAAKGSAGAGTGLDRTRTAVQQLRGYLLAYGPEQQLQLVPAVDELLGPYPAGLGRPGAELGQQVAELAADPARLRRTLLSAPPAARAVLDRLAAGPPVGTVSEDTAASGRSAAEPAVKRAAEGTAASGRSAAEPAVKQAVEGTADPASDRPVGWLVSHGLLAVVPPPAAGSEPAGGAGRTVELPRELGLLLRRDAGPLGPLHPEPPQPSRDPLDPAAVDAAGTGQAMELVRLAGVLLEALATEPAPVLRSGGIGIRELRRLARAAGLTEPVAGLLLETGYAAGLLGETEDGNGARAAARGAAGRGGAPELRPTAGYDAWAGAPIAGRWHALVTGWLAMTRQPGLIGQRDGKDRVIGALDPAAERAGAPGLRRTVLEVLGRLPPGTAPTLAETVALVGWHAPRRVAGGDREPLLRQLLAEAATLGLTGQAALASYARTLLAERSEPPAEEDPLGIQAGDTPAGLAPAAAALARLLPAPVAGLLVQADLTVVVPGPPEPSLAAELELVTEPESAGAGSVHRVTRNSLRRALDAGHTAEDLHALFARRSRTPVPQALSYLIDDVARAHGGLRVGSVGAYLRSDDQALVAQVLADRRLAPLGLRRLASTVLASAAGTGRLLAALREAGYAPVPEDASGTAVLVRPRTRRAPARPRTATVDPFARPRVSTPRLLGIVEDLRRGDAAVRAAQRASAALRPANGRPAAGAHTEAMVVLQQAVRDKALVVVGYVDAHGARTSRLLRPVSVGGGYLRAEDERAETEHTLALHRITGASLEVES